ncbi:MAG TPA: Crp/Fnr family transcriptional regulator [Elusimicrobiota bacterium]|nr:Crp/Fnr family transcriptional regulator [Elusimicrobiota bacterium]
MIFGKSIVLAISLLRPSIVSRMRLCDGDSCPLRELPVFEGVALDIWRRFASAVIANTYRRGDILFYEGNLPAGLYFSCHGRVKLVKDNHSGRSQIVRIVEAPNFVGDRAFFSGRHYAASGVAMEDSTICFLDAGRFWSLFNDQSNLTRHLAQRFAQELGQAEERMHCLAVCSIKGRLASYLLKRFKPSCAAIASGRGAAPVVELKESRTELAQILGTTVEAISRTLAEFRDKGIIAVDGRRITLRNRERLGRLGCGECLANSDERV